MPDPSVSKPAATGPLAVFVEAMSNLVDGATSEEEVLRAGREHLGTLISRDDWLSDEWTAPDPERYRQNLLYCDAGGRFSVVSFVWGPGQATPVHDHRTWGLIGMLRGAEDATPFAYSDDDGLRQHGDPTRLRPGDIDAVSPTVGDIHQVRNAFDDRTSVSIHVYGANIGTVERAVYPGGLDVRPFVSSYANASLPNPWAPART